MVRVHVYAYGVLFVYSVFIFIYVPVGLNTCKLERGGGGIKVTNDLIIRP